MFLNFIATHSATHRTENHRDRFTRARANQRPNPQTAQRTNHSPYASFVVIRDLCCRNLLDHT